MVQDRPRGIENLESARSAKRSSSGERPREVGTKKVRNKEKDRSE